MRSSNLFCTVLVIGLALLACCTAPAVASGVDKEYTNGAQPGDIGRQVDRVLGRSRAYAVLVGVSEFAGSENNGFTSLGPARNDVDRMRKMLIEEAGFDVVYVVSEDKATKQRIDSLMVDILPNRVRSDDRFLFYWSGHGVSRNPGGGKTVGYLPLANSRRGVYSDMVSMEDVARWDGLISAKQTLFIIDTCLSGLAGSQAKTDQLTLTMEQLNRPSHHLLSAGLGTEQAIVGDRWGGSLFTDAFIRGVKGAAVMDGVPVISLSDVIAYVRRQVAFEKDRANWTSSITPQLRQLQFSEGEFFFTKPAARSLAAAAPLPFTPVGVTKPKGDEPLPDLGSAASPVMASITPQKAAAKLTLRSASSRTDFGRGSPNAFALHEASGAEAFTQPAAGMSKDSVVVATPDGEKRVIDVGSNSKDALAFSGNGKQLLIHQYGGDCFVANVDREAAVQKIDSRFSLQFCSWSKSQPHLVIRASVASGAVETFDTSTGRSSRVAALNGLIPISETPDGRVVLERASPTGAGRSTELWLSPSWAPFSARKIATVGANGKYAVTGERILVVDGEGYRIFGAADGRLERTVANAVDLDWNTAPHLEHASLSRDGRKILSFVALGSRGSKGSELRVLDASTGRALVATRAKGDNLFGGRILSQSPDGRFVLFEQGYDGASSNPRFAVMNLDTFEVVTEQGSLGAVQPVWLEGGRAFASAAGRFTLEEQ